MANENTTTTVFSPNYSIKIHKWKVREGFQVNNNQVILLYESIGGDDKEIKRFKSTKCGVVKKRHHKDGDIVDVEWVYVHTYTWQHADPAKKKIIRKKNTRKCVGNAPDRNCSLPTDTLFPFRKIVILFFFLLYFDAGNHCSNWLIAFMQL